MNATKFLFDTDFEDTLPEEAMDVEEFVEEEPPPPTFSEEELAVARTEGYAEGLAAGRIEAEAGTERLAAQALEIIGSGLASLGRAQSASTETTRREALALAAAITRKTVPAITIDSVLPTIENFVQDCLTQIMTEPRVVVRVNDAVLDPIRQRLEPMAAQIGFPGEIIIIADAGLAHEDCRIEWADGGTEHDTSRVWSEIDETIGRYLDAAPTETHADPDSDEPEAAPIVKPPETDQTPTQDSTP